MAQTMDTQKSTYDQVRWLGSNVLTPNLPISNTYTSAAKGTAPGAPFWTFQLDCSKSTGLRAQNIRVKDGSHTTDVLREIAFHPDVIVKLERQEKADDGKWKDAGNALVTVKPNEGIHELYHSEGGAITKADEKTIKGKVVYAYQRGFKSGSTTVVKWTDGTPAVDLTVDRSLVFLNLLPNIEPGRLVEGLYLYPELTSSWQQHSGVAANVRYTVIFVRAALKTSVNVKHPSGHGSHGVHSTETVASFFVDNNGPPGLPDWGSTFGYHYPDAKEEKLINAVRHEPGGKELKNRDVKFVWTSGADVKDATVVKFGRQLAYDNIHIHAQMGAIKGPGGALLTQVHAPFCVHSCIHMHWRWGDGIAKLGYVEGNEYSSKFYGWGKKTLGMRGFLPVRDKTSRPKSVAGEPMIPPNQDLAVALAHPGSVPFDHSLSPISKSSPKEIQHSDEKVIWCIATVNKPRANLNQVFFSNGLGYAVRLYMSFGNVGAALLGTGPAMDIDNKMFWLAWKYGVDEPEIDDSLPIDKQRDQFEEIVGHLYARLRYENYPDVSEEASFGKWTDLVPRCPVGTQAMESG